MKYKMDYIADKNIYTAVMYACKLMRPPYNKYYSDAIGIASRTYDVKYETINHYVSQRSGRTKKNTKGIKYKWFICGIFEFISDEDTGHRYLQHIKIQRATKKENAENFHSTTWKGYLGGGKGSWGEDFYFYRAYDKEFETKKDAEKFLNDNEDLILKEFKKIEW